MTEELKKAQFLVQNLGREDAINHVKFVLSYEYGLRKHELRIFWEKVKMLLKEF